ncbi:MAG: helix-turn-helix domain-containing protein [Solirubrobacteraceae bacterium]
MTAREKLTDRVAALTVPMLLSVAEVAEVLSCSTQTVRRRIHSGELPAVLDNGRLMVRGDDLRAFIDGLERIGRTSSNSGRRSRKTPTANDFDWLLEP